MLDTVTYRNEDVIKMVKPMVSVKVNGKVDTAIANMYGIAGYPTVILANSDGTEIDRVYGYEEPPVFMTIITDYLADRNTLADFLRQADTAAGMSLYLKIADKYTGRKKFTEAETYYRKILQGDPANKQGYSDTALFNMGDMKTRAKDFSMAEEMYDRLEKTYPESELVDDAAFARGVTLRRADRFADAIAAFEAFVKAYPESELVTEAKIYIPYCHALNDNTDEAVRLYGEFLADYPDSPDGDWVRGQIEKLTSPPADKGN